MEVEMNHAKEGDQSSHQKSLETSLKNPQLKQITSIIITIIILLNKGTINNIITAINNIHQRNHEEKEEMMTLQVCYSF